MLGMFWKRTTGAAAVAAIIDSAVTVMGKITRVDAADLNQPAAYRPPGDTILGYRPEHLREQAHHPDPHFAVSLEIRIPIDRYRSVGQIHLVDDLIH